MGKITVFCLISGCTPEIPHRIRTYQDYQPPNSVGRLVSQALSELGTEEETVNDVTAIGDFDAHENQDSGGGIPKEIALGTPDFRISALRHCRAGGSWEHGAVDGPFGLNGKADARGPFLVSFGALLMVQTFALPILHLATHGRVTPARLWRLAVHQGHSDLSGDCSGLVDVDYGEISEQREQYPDPIPWMNAEAVISLEELGDVQAIKETIIHRGGFWMWMSPDSFPIELASCRDDPPLTLIEPPMAGTTLSAVESLPCELLCAITEQLPMTSLFSLSSTSRTLRAILLGSEAGRNAIARGWIMKSAPWYIPVATSRDYEPHFEMGQVCDPWAYMRRCLSSGSMRNRVRIWKAAEQIDKLVGQLYV
ncbi:hypothetical protein CONPUDRAFT_138240 [Coniophora puteana RWD-64-598 SS2]|uniref:F-box domain-containing protein n=1 Tax=Coniophora puteana (strain RWD-64-598) TaxID=741705 RepID=A0A5M3MIF5_CONPW|nr:uncharacterized protein CONPUDRAFT_138240 [Coniophora puteana RWD-64-598 SS2]EIW78992.1 hypothetical protein CONPUDRAFT_138240 [Coniophora puteana RWD-64-598 SS2]